MSWNWFGDYVGWAPLGYWGRPAYNQYVFVRNSDFCAPYVGRRAVGYDGLPRGALVHWRDHPGQPPPYSTIQRVGRYPMTVLHDRPGGSLAPWDRTPGLGGRTTGPLVLDRDGRRGAPAPGPLDRRPGAGTAGLDHALRPDADRPRGGVERPWRMPSGGRATLDRRPLVVERGGGRDAVGVQPGAPTWSGGRWGSRTPGGGGMRGPLTIQRGGDGGRFDAGYRGSFGGGPGAMGSGPGGSMGGGRAAGGGGGISGGAGGFAGGGARGGGGGGVGGGGGGSGRGGGGHGGGGGGHGGR